MIQFSFRIPGQRLLDSMDVMGYYIDSHQQHHNGAIANHLAMAHRLSTVSSKCQTQSRCFHAGFSGCLILWGGFLVLSSAAWPSSAWNKKQDIKSPRIQRYSQSENSSHFWNLHWLNLSQFLTEFVVTRESSPWIRQIRSLSYIFAPSVIFFLITYSHLN